MTMYDKVATNVVCEARTYRLPSLADTTMPTLAIRYSLAHRAGELPTAQPCKATITISATGGSGSKLRVTIKEYVNDTNGDATVATTTNLDGATYTTLKALVDALNAIAGITAWVLHAPFNYSTDSNDFIALSETDLRTDGRYLETLYRDASEVATAYLRIGNPQVWDKGRLTIKRIYGTCTGDTNGTVKLIRDEYGKDQVELQKFTLDEPLTDYVNHKDNEAQDYQCPLLLAIAADNLTVVDFNVVAIQASI
jgi:hypothetical protein